MKLENPELENPKLEIPELKNPELETPKLEIPELKTQIKKYPRLKNPKLQNPNPETTAADAAGVGIKRRPFSHSHATLGSLRRRLDLKDILDPDLLMEAASELSIINSFSSKHAAKELLGKGLEANMTPLEDMASALRQSEITLGDDADPDAIEALKAHGLPVTKKNLASLNRVLGLIPSEPLPDAAIAEILKKSHLVLSVIYKARHFFSTAQSVELADESMVPELKKLYERLGIEPSEELVNVGLFLLGANLPVTRSNISRVRLLKALPDSVDRKKVLDRASSNLSRGIPLASIDLEFKGEKTAIAAGQPAISTKTNASTPVSIFGRSVIMGNAKSTPASDGYKRLHSFRPLSKPMAASITDALSKYESNQTEILPEYGDSFEKAKGHIGDALLGMGYDATEENKKAAEILARNEAEITLENLEAAKELNAKVSRLSSELHPRIALKMIKEGASPLSLHVDDALRYIDKSRESYGGDYGDKIAALVLEMDRANELDPETRESVIGIYRMLSVIEKNGGAALGAALKSNASHTLGSLYDLAKSMDKSVRLQAYDGIENKVSEATDNSVRSVFERAEELKFKSNRDTLNVLINRASSFPEAIKKNPAVLELPLEELANLLPSSDISRLNRAASLLKSLSRTRPETIAWMRANGLPATLGNLMGLRMLGESFFYPLDSLEDECQGLEDLEPEEALDRIEERLSAKRDTARGDELEKAVNALNALRTSRKLEREDRFLSKSLTPVSVFYNSKDGTQAVITIGATLGVVQANAEANGDQIDLSVKLENCDKLEIARERIMEFFDKVELKGLEKGIPKNMIKDIVPGLRDKNR